MKKLVVFFVFVSVLFIFTFTSLGESFALAQESNSSAKSMAVIETHGNRILYSKNSDEKLPMASTTKIVTAITVLENCDNIDAIVKIKKEVTLVEGTSIYLKEGEELSVRELLYGLMLQSGNDAALALATYISPTIEDFCDKMQQTAIRAGAQNSSFKNPHGLDAVGHYTTAYDLAVITGYALKNPTFKEIVSCKSYKIEQRENTQTRYLKNKNRLLNSLDGCIGVKTGFTSKAGRCLVTAVERENMQIVSVVFNCGPMFEESEDLIERGFNEYKVEELLREYNILTELPVQNGKKTYVKVHNKNGFQYALKEGERSNIYIEYLIPHILEAPLKKDQIIGKINIYFNKDLLFSSNVYTIEGVDSTSTRNTLKEILEKWNKG